MKNTKHLSEFMKYTCLNVLGMIGLSCYILADTFFISKGLGANGLAALNLAIPVYSFIHGTGLMLGMGGATRYSISKSQDRKEEGNTIFTASICLAAAFAFIFFMCGLLLSRQIALAVGADNAVFKMTETYLRVILLFSPMFILNDIFVCFVRNDGNPKLSMFAMLSGSFSNILLDYIFIFPLGMGIFGAVLATGFAPVISMLVLSAHLFCRKAQFHLQRPRLTLHRISAILSVGFPSLVTEVSSGVVIIIFNMIILNLQGNVGVAAYGVIANLSLVVVAVFTGVAQGIQPLLSNAYGRGDKQHIRSVMRYSEITIILISVLVYIIFFFGADPISAIFNSENNLKMQSMAVYGLKIYFTAVFFVSQNIVLSVFFTSTDNPMPAHLISLLRGFVIIIPMAFILSWIWGITGVWVVFPVTELIVTLIGLAFFIKSRKHS